jgi:RNA polymerase sigma factor (sigma-70 family)
MSYNTRSPTWLTEIYPVVKRFALAKTRSKELAEDLAQDLVEGLLKADNLPEIIMNDSWLRTRLTWLMINRHNARRREERIFLPEPEDGWERQEESGIASSEQIQAPDLALFEGEMAREIANAVSELPQHLQAIMRLVLAEQTDAEIAETLGIEPAQVWKQRQMANAHLLQRLNHFRSEDIDGKQAHGLRAGAGKSPKERLARIWQAEFIQLRELAASLHLTWVGPIHRIGGLTVWRCDAGFEWLERAHNLAKRGGCQHCLNRRHLTWSHYHVMGRKKGLVLIGEKPDKSDKPTRWRCLAEDHRLWASYDDVRDWQACPACQNRVPLSLEDYKLVAEERGGEFVGTLPRTRHDHAIWRCKVHGEWPASYNSVVSQKSWCPACAGKARKTLTDYECAAARRGGRFLGPLPANVDSLGGIWQCKLLHTWNARYNDVSRKSWCPKCAGKVALTNEDYHNLARLLGIRLVGELPPCKKDDAEWETNEPVRFWASYKTLSALVSIGHAEQHG